MLMLCRRGSGGIGDRFTAANLTWSLAVACPLLPDEIFIGDSGLLIIKLLTTAS